MAKQMLAGELSYIEGSRGILSLLPAAHVKDRERYGDFLAFVAIDSETDHFSIGAVRVLWQRQALESLQPEFDAAEARAKSQGESACIWVIDHFARFPSGEF